MCPGAWSQLTRRLRHWQGAAAEQRCSRWLSTSSTLRSPRKRQALAILAEEGRGDSVVCLWVSISSRNDWGDECSAPFVWLLALRCSVPDWSADHASVLAARPRPAAGIDRCWQGSFIASWGSCPATHEGHMHVGWRPCCV